MRTKRAREDLILSRENAEQKQETYLKRGKTRMTKLKLVLVCILLVDVVARVS